MSDSKKKKKDQYPWFDDIEAQKPATLRERLISPFIRMRVFWDGLPGWSRAAILVALGFTLRSVQLIPRGPEVIARARAMPACEQLIKAELKKASSLAQPRRY